MGVQIKPQKRLFSSQTTDLFQNTKKRKMVSVGIRFFVLHIPLNRAKIITCRLQFTWFFVKMRKTAIFFSSTQVYPLVSHAKVINQSFYRVRVNITNNNKLCVIVLECVTLVCLETLRTSIPVNTVGKQRLFTTRVNSKKNQ